MRLKSSVLLALFILMVGQFSVAEGSQNASCWPQFTAANTHADLSGDTEIPLMTENLTERYVTEAKLLFKASAAGDVTVYGHYSDENQQFGLAYNIYALMIYKNGKLIVFEDFMSQCQSPGVSMFPGDTFEISNFKNPNPSSNDVFQIIAWGR